MVMVKPGRALSGRDPRAAGVKEAFGVPTFAYQVSGEYLMLEAAAAAGWLDRRAVILESLTGIVRAGADMVLTYHAREAARWLREQD